MPIRKKPGNYLMILVYVEKLKKKVIKSEEFIVKVDDFTIIYFHIYIYIYIYILVVLYLKKRFLSIFLLGSSGFMWYPNGINFLFDPT